MINKMLAGLLRNMTFVPQKGAHGYPLDLNGFEDFTRPFTGLDVFPNHSNSGANGNFQKLGYINAMVPQQSDISWAGMYAAEPFGPIMNPLPPSINSNINIPALAKGS